MASCLPRTLLALVAVPAVALAGTPASARGGTDQDTYGAVPAVPDPELARATGKFVLPNGAELALSIVSDAAVDGRAVLRTVLTVDQSVDLKVFARPVGASDAATPAGGTATTAASSRAPVPGPSVAVMFDRQSGARLVTPVVAGAPSVAVGTGAGGSGADAAAGAEARGLTPVTLAAGGPAVATADGHVTLTELPNGSAVALQGDRYGVLQLVGRSVAAATVNSANDRVLDSVTDVAVDLRNVTPFTAASAMMRADALALDATARMVR